MQQTNNQTNIMNKQTEKTYDMKMKIVLMMQTDYKTNKCNKQTIKPI